MQRVTSNGSGERNWKRVGERRTERRLEKRAACPAGRNRRGGRVVRRGLQPLHVHQRLCRTSLILRPNPPFRSGSPEPKSMLTVLGPSPVPILLCQLHRFGLTKTARPRELSCPALSQTLHRVGLSTDGSIPFPSERQFSKYVYGLARTKALSGAAERLFDRTDETIGHLLHLLVLKLARLTELVRQVQGRQDGDFGGRGHFHPPGQGSHLLVHFPGQLIDVRLVGFSPDRVPLAVDLDLKSLAHHRPPFLSVSPCLLAGCPPDARGAPVRPKSSAIGPAATPAPSRAGGSRPRGVPAWRPPREGGIPVAPPAAAARWNA